MYILFCFTLRDGDRIYNTAGLWGADGHLAGLYHKTHLQNHDLQYDAGRSLPVFPTPWGPLGVMICADRRWPETARTLRVKGARLILNPSYGMHHDRNQMWMQTRGYENQCFIAFTHPVQSLLIGPRGDVIERVDGETPGLLVREIDLSEAKDDNHIRDRRPELYGALDE
jgi:predicted amidohydrolase